MSPTINYQSVDICSFNRASGWPRYDASSIQLIQCCALPQHTVVVLFIIGAELSHNGQSCLGQLNPGSIYLGRVVTWTREGGNFFRMVIVACWISLVITRKKIHTLMGLFLMGLFYIIIE